MSLKKILISNSFVYGVHQRFYILLKELFMCPQLQIIETKYICYLILIIYPSPAVYFFKKNNNRYHIAVYVVDWHLHTMRTTSTHHVYICEDY